MTLFVLNLFALHLCALILLSNNNFVTQLILLLGCILFAVFCMPTPLHPPRVSQILVVLTQRVYFVAYNPSTQMVRGVWLCATPTLPQVPSFISAANLVSQPCTISLGTPWLWTL